MHTCFLVFTDLHVDMIHDGAVRAAIIADAARAHKVDFAVQLGDLMYPDEGYLAAHSPCSLDMMKEVRPWAVGRDDERFAVQSAFAGMGAPLYHVLGNHDMHIGDKALMTGYLGMPGTHYHFVQGGVRFVVLDTNFMRTEEGIRDIEWGRGAGKPGNDLKFITPEQLQWLEDTVMQSREPCVLFSHASLVDPLSGIRDKAAFTAMLSRVNRDKKRILAALNGHSHVDGMRTVCGAAFININSASYHWLGGDYECVRYSEKLSRAYPRIMRTAPYHAPLYAIVEITDGKLRLTGRKSCFVGKTPDELGLPREENDFAPTPVIRSRLIRL